MENNTFPKVAVGVCTYNRSNDLKRLLNSLKKLNYPNFEIIVVDNNSNDDTEKVAKSFSNVKYVKEEKQGIAYARNKLIKSCEKDVEYLGMLDDDETVEPDWINKMLECMFLNEKIVAVGGPYIPKFEIEPPIWMPDAFHSYGTDIKGVSVYKKTGIITGNAFIKLSALSKKNIKFNVNLGYKGNKTLPGEDNEVFDNLISEEDLCGFTEYACINHYIDKERMTFEWFVKRYFYEGVSQYYRFGTVVYFKNLLQFPLRVLNLLITLLSFNSKRITLRFFKVVMNFGVIIAPMI